jgi:hypothetical protein
MRGLVLVLASMEAARVVRAGVLRGFGLSHTAPGEEQHFCYPFDRCKLDPVPRTVFPRSGMGLSHPLRPDPYLLSGRTAPTSHQAPGLGTAPVLASKPGG